MGWGSLAAIFIKYHMEKNILKTEPSQAEFRDGEKPKLVT